MQISFALEGGGGEEEKERLTWIERFRASGKSSTQHWRVTEEGLYSAEVLLEDESSLVPKRNRR